MFVASIIGMERAADNSGAFFDNKRYAFVDLAAYYLCAFSHLHITDDERALNGAFTGHSPVIGVEWIAFVGEGYIDLVNDRISYALFVFAQSIVDIVLHVVKVKDAPSHKARGEILSVLSKDTTKGVTQLLLSCSSRSVEVTLSTGNHNAEIPELTHFFLHGL